MKSKKQMEGLAHGQRKRWSAAEKLRIVLAEMEPGTEISDLCRREGVNPTMYYQWKRQLPGAAERRKEHKPSAREQRLSTELTRAKDMIAEITAENLDLKKMFSG